MVSQLRIEHPLSFVLRVPWSVLLRLAKLFVPPVVSSALNAVSSWPQPFRLPESAFSARTPSSEELSEIRVRDESGVVPPSAFTDSAVRNTRPYTLHSKPGTGLNWASASGEASAVATAATAILVFIRDFFVRVEDKG